MILLWDCYGIAVELLCDLLRVSVGLLSDSCGIAVELLWDDGRRREML